MIKAWLKIKCWVAEFGMNRIHQVEPREAKPFTRLTELVLLRLIVIVGAGET